MRGRAVLHAGAVVLTCASTIAGARAEPPRRIVSMNMCTDQLLLALAPRDRIAALSPLSRDLLLSFTADEARDIPQNSGRGETVVLGGADLVLAGPFEGRARRDLLARFGFEVMVLGLWTSLDQGREQIRTLAARLGRTEAGEALVGRIDAARSRAKGAAPAPRSILVLQRRGYTPGTTSYLDGVLREIGLVPHAAALGLARGGTVSLEKLVANPPDYVLMAESDGRAEDQGSALLAHPALAAVLPPERRLALPDRLTICGGPATPAAIDALAAQVREKVR
jgi:iron complex transport system substrate-binding protein